MKHIFALFLCLACMVVAKAQQPAADTYPKDYFRHPLDVNVYITGSFGEIRPHHFHSGVDFGVNGKVGTPIYAPADGYVSRVNISGYGGGKVLYITHPNGLRTVYMHCNEFCGKIGEFVTQYQYAHHCFAFDTNLADGFIKVKKGDMIARAGNTGGSFGPHLHYEVRHAHNDQPINPLYFGTSYTDGAAPVIAGIKLYPATINTTLNGKCAEHNLPLKASKGSDTVRISGRFYTGIYAYDVPSVGSGSKNGVERIELYIDSKLAYTYRNSTYLFENTRGVNSLIDFPEYKRSSRYYILTRQLRGATFDWIETSNRGYFYFDEPGLHKFEYKVYDLKGNKCHHTFWVRSLTPTHNETAERDTTGEPIAYFVKKQISRPDFCAIIPEYTVYDNDYLTYSTSPASIGQRHTLLLRRYPLPPHQAFTVRLRIPEGCRKDHLVIVSANGKSRNALPTTLSDDGWLTAQTKFWGGFEIQADTTAPKVTPVNFKNNQTFSGKELQIKISDNLSGINTYHCYINGQWQLAELDGKSATLSVSARHLVKGKNLVRMEVTDLAGNKTQLEYTLTR